MFGRHAPPTGGRWPCEPDTKSASVTDWTLVAASTLMTLMTLLIWRRSVRDDIWEERGNLTLTRDAQAGSVVLPPLSENFHDAAPLRILLVRYLKVPEGVRQNFSLQLANGQTFSSTDIDELLTRADSPLRVEATDQPVSCTDEARQARPLATQTQPRPNLSTENQPDGAGRRPSDTLDREPKRDPLSGGSIPSNYNPDTMTRIGEESDSRAGKEGVGRRT